MTFLIIGLIIHPFFNGLLILDFTRHKELKNVVKAVWKPKNILALSFMVFVLIEYYFAVVGYVYLADQYEDGYEGACYQLYRCFFKTFDWTFKEGAGVGGFLTDPEEPEMTPKLDFDSDGEPIVIELINERYLARFLYDNLYTWILIIIMINMVAGIIIDTFGSLKAEDLMKA